MTDDKKDKSTASGATVKTDDRDMVFEFVVDKQKVDPKTMNVKFEKIPQGVRVIVAARCM